MGFQSFECIPNTICFEVIEIKARNDGAVFKRGMTKQKNPSPYVSFRGMEHNGNRWTFTAFDETAKKILGYVQDGKFVYNAKFKIFGTITSYPKRNENGEDEFKIFCKVTDLYYRGTNTSAEATTPNAVMPQAKDEKKAEPAPKKQYEVDHSMFSTDIRAAGKSFG